MSADSPERLERGVHSSSGPRLCFSCCAGLLLLWQMRHRQFIDACDNTGLCGGALHLRGGMEAVRRWRLWWCGLQATALTLTLLQQTPQCKCITTRWT